ncbi:MAG: hypothetical protein FOGNACKC_05745 [Anaerolineae bacterium]|nr:hypothetical protein [Anaerolineae bacterium]
MTHAADIVFNPASPPPPLHTSEPGSFARNTIAVRKPAIVEQVLADFPDFPPAIVAGLEQLRSELADDQPVQPLRTRAGDGPAWAEAWEPHRGQSWLNIPWFFAEVFFYRRLLETTGYFGSDDPAVARWQGIDPFLPRKQAELAEPAPWQVLRLALAHSADNTADSFRALLHHAVWGNRVDLSYNQVAQDAGRQIAIEREQANLLVDDTEAVLAHLAPTGGRVDFIADNSGTELLLDLALADFLLRFGWSSQITLHVKFHPTYVSDATPTDVDWTIGLIQQRAEADLAALGQRLASYRQSGRLPLHDDIFWNGPQFFWELPPNLRRQLAQARLVVVKGDANYRRLLGDHRWPAAALAQNVINYFPAPLVSLRTMKSDPVIGLQPGQAEALDGVDPAWRVNGKRGLIQAVLAGQ